MNADVDTVDAVDASAIPTTNDDAPSSEPEDEETDRTAGSSVPTAGVVVAAAAALESESAQQMTSVHLPMTRSVFRMPIRENLRLPQSSQRCQNRSTRST